MAERSSSSSSASISLSSSISALHPTFAECTFGSEEKLHRLSVIQKRQDLTDTLGIRYLYIGDDLLVAKLPVTAGVSQPMGLLHGGATISLAESMGSVGAMLFARPSLFAVGLQLNAHHISSARIGDTVVGFAHPVRVGGRTQVWAISVHVVIPPSSASSSSSSSSETVDPVVAARMAKHPCIPNHRPEPVSYITFTAFILPKSPFDDGTDQSHQRDSSHSDGDGSGGGDARKKKPTKQLKSSI